MTEPHSLLALPLLTQLAHDINGKLQFWKYSFRS